MIGSNDRLWISVDGVILYNLNIVNTLEHAIKVNRVKSRIAVL